MALVTAVGRVEPLADVGVARWLLTDPLRISTTDRCRLVESSEDGCRDVDRRFHCLDSLVHHR
jgi:hypothetical protein